MIVDDDTNMTKLLKTMLELESDEFEVQVVPRGADALPKARQNPPQLFMIDYNLNDIDGLEVMGQLRSDSEFAHTPIIIASGLDVENEALDAGADMFLLKPFEPGDLPYIFKELLR
jgi:DNA-binding response OmpR family regulator